MNVYVVWSTPKDGVSYENKVYIIAASTKDAIRLFYSRLGVKHQTTSFINCEIIMYKEETQ